MFTKFESQINDLDINLFNYIPSQTTDEDKRSLLLVQRTIRLRGSYIYLEIGSHLGGTIQPYYQDPLCSLIYSIDYRPELVPDERGIHFNYPDNSSDNMIKNLEQSYPSIEKSKIVVFDNKVEKISKEEIKNAPSVCFIDGEHTNVATLNDFLFCLEICVQNSIIVFHDSDIIFRAILEIKEILVKKKINFRGLKLGGSVYAILLNDAVSYHEEGFKNYLMSEADYFHNAKRKLRETQWINWFDKHPIINRPRILFLKIRDHLSGK